MENFSTQEEEKKSPSSIPSTTCSGKVYEKMAEIQIKKIFSGHQEPKNYGNQIEKNQTSLLWTITQSEIGQIKDPSVSQVLKIYQQINAKNKNSQVKFLPSKKFLNPLKPLRKILKIQSIEIDLLLQFPNGIMMSKNCNSRAKVVNLDEIKFDHQQEFNKEQGVNKAVMIIESTKDRRSLQNKIAQLEKQIMLVKLLYPGWIIYPGFCTNGKNDLNIQNLCLFNFLHDEAFMKTNLYYAWAKKRLIWIHLKASILMPLPAHNNVIGRYHQQIKGGRYIEPSNGSNASQQYMRSGGESSQGVNWKDNYILQLERHNDELRKDKDQLRKDKDQLRKDKDQLIQKNEMIIGLLEQKIENLQEIQDQMKLEIDNLKSNNQKSCK